MWVLVKIFLNPYPRLFPNPYSLFLKIAADRYNHLYLPKNDPSIETPILKT
ncbi:MAG: hypothetical protein ACK544_02900 [Microcystis sp.]|uniref:Uncharacterized protein n=1 Tax=Microcystis aeruginosa G11-04 TaxID=2685956 RepID=A0A966G001_MICAE|nr:hypothetical protein [Microcystis aeruginosa G11-04]NCT43595.1 hypothetical protein [Microcystis aeruginosa G11-09]